MARGAQNEPKNHVGFLTVLCPSQADIHKTVESLDFPELLLIEGGCYVPKSSVISVQIHDFKYGGDTLGKTLMLFRCRTQSHSGFYR